MSDFYREKHVKKTRSEHRCLGCTEKIPKGSEALYLVAVFEGDFGAYHMCLTCMDYIDKNPSVAEDGFREGEIWEARRRDEREKMEDERRITD